MKLLLKLENGINAICNALNFVAIFTIVVVATVQVVGRYVFNYGSAWTDELCNYLQIFITYIGMAYLVSTRGHLAVDLIRNINSAPLNKVLNILSILCGLVFAYFIIRYGIVQAMAQMNQRCNGLPISMGVVYLVSLPLGGALAFLNGVIALVKELSGYSEEEQKATDTF